MPESPQSPSQGNPVPIEKLKQLIGLGDFAGSDFRATQAILALIETTDSTDQISRAIEKDPTMALKVLRVASSPAFAAREVTSIKQATALIGTNQVKMIVSSVGMNSLANDCLRQGTLTPEHFRNRSTLLAMLMRTLANQLKLGEPEVHYMSGLFMGCGYLPICKQMPWVPTAVMHVSGCENLSEAESKVLGYTSSEVGLEIGNSIGLHPITRDVIAFHVQPESYQGENPKSVFLGNVCSWAADQAGLTRFPGSQGYGMHPDALTTLGIEQDMLDYMVQSMLGHVSAMAQAAA